jgi:hypothetical protein
VNDEQQPDPRPGAYYVTVIDGDRFGYLAGPWPTHAEALAHVGASRRVACDLDPRAHFYAFGTARLPDDDGVPIRAASLNGRLGLPVAPYRPPENMVCMAAAEQRHILYECPPGCENPHCNYCMGGLESCVVCGQAEAELEASCPGKKGDGE